MRRVYVPLDEEKREARAAGFEPDPGARVVWLDRRIPPVTREVHAILGDVYRRLRNQRISEGIRSSSKRQGPDRVFDHEEVRRLASTGLSQRQVARAIGCSQETVRRALKEAGE